MENYKLKCKLERCRQGWLDEYKNKKSKDGLKEALDTIDRVAKRNNLVLTHETVKE